MENKQQIMSTLCIKKKCNHEFDTITPIFGIENIIANTHKLYNASDEVVNIIRVNLLKLAEDEIPHFKNLPWTITVIKKVEEKKDNTPKRSNKGFNYSKVYLSSQGSTTFGSPKSVSDSSDKEEMDSVSSCSNDSNEVDILDLLNEDFPILLNSKKLELGQRPKAIPTFNEFE